MRHARHEKCQNGPSLSVLLADRRFESAHVAGWSRTKVRVLVTPGPRRADSTVWLIRKWGDFDETPPTV
jgi:hypothetical protein